MSKFNKNTPRNVENRIPQDESHKKRERKCVKKQKIAK